MSKRKGQARTPLDPDDVLAGRARPSAAELLELIHRANPTGRELSARETELRYAQKARLQSLLVRRFPDEIEVVPEREGTVSLRHRGHGRDACHAVVATLDEDARSWVQRQIDLGAGRPEEARPPAERPSTPRGATASKEEPPPDSEAASPDSLTRRAEEEIEAYDYEAARLHLDRAVRASGGAPGPAAALLALLVDTLGEDAAALEIEAKLPRASLADGRVRGLCALAAARSGMEERALTLSRGLAEEPAAAVLAALASSALAAGDVERAAGHLDKAKRLDPTSAALAPIAAEVSKARAAARGPAEAEIAALLAAGRDAEAEKAARAVLARWPESEAARRAIRTLEERRRSSEAARLAREAEEALALGTTSVALGFYRQAIAAARGPERDALERRLREIEAQDRAAREAEQVEHAVRLLDGPEPREGLFAFLALDEGLRARVRARCPRPELDALALVAETRAADRAKVDAVLALGRARAIAEHEPEAALALLGPHAATLEHAPEAKKIAHDAEARLRAARLSRAQAEVRAARAELADGKAAEALARLEAAALRELPEDERAEAAACSAEAARVLDRKRREAEAVKLRAEGKLFEARALAEGLAGEGGTDRARWERERDAIRAEIHRLFRVEVDPEPHPNAELARLGGIELDREVPWWLSGDGRRAFFASTHDRWVVVRVLELETRQIRPTVSLRTPEPLGEIEAMLMDATLWLVGSHQALLEIDVDTWEVNDFQILSDLAAVVDRSDKLRLVPGPDPASPRHLWSIPYRTFDRRNLRMRVTDLGQHRVVREIQGDELPFRIAGRTGAHVGVMAEDDGCALYTARGAPALPGRIGDAFRVHGVAEHPGGRGFVVLANRREQDEARDATEPLWPALITPSGQLVRSGPIDLSMIDSVASARESGLVLLRASFRNDEVVCALDASGDGELSLLWQARVADATCLVQDARASVVAAVTLHDEGVDTTLLGRARPEIPRRGLGAGVSLPGHADVMPCLFLAPARDTEADALLDAMQGRSDMDVVRWAEEQEKRPDATARELFVAMLVVRKREGGRMRAHARKMLARLVERPSSDPETLLFAAQEHALKSRWTEAGLALRRIDGGVPDRTARHLHHLRALVALHEGRLDDARAEADAGEALPGGCMFGFVRELAQPDDPAHEGSAVAELFRTVREADACLARGDHRAALGLLDRPLVWSANELQSTARLACAYLGIAPTSPVERVRKRAAVGELLDRLGKRRASQDGVFPALWGPDVIAELAARARAWIDGDEHGAG